MTVKDIQEKYVKQKGFTMLSDALMRNLGNDEAIVYTKLVGFYIYYQEEKKLSSDGFFFFTVDDLEYNCNVSKYQQKKILDDLIDRGLIKVDYRGLPKRRFIKVLCDEEAVAEAFKDSGKSIKDSEEFPQEVKDRYSKPFDEKVLEKQVNKACKKIQPEISPNALFLLYKRFFDWFGYPSTYLSQFSVESLAERFDELNEEFDVEEMFDDYCEEYERSTQNKSFIRSINDLLTYNVLDILQKRLI